MCFNILEMVHDSKCMILLLQDSHLLTGFCPACPVAAAANAASLRIPVSSALPLL